MKGEASLLLRLNWKITNRIIFPLKVYIKFKNSQDIDHFWWMKTQWIWLLQNQSIFNVTFIICVQLCLKLKCEGLLPSSDTKFNMPLLCLILEYLKTTIKVKFHVAHLSLHNYAIIWHGSSLLWDISMGTAHTIGSSMFYYNN